MRQFFQNIPEFFDDLVYFHNQYQNSTQYDVQSIKSDQEDEIFRQAVYCFLTPATKSDSADHTYAKLFTDNYFYTASLEDITATLREKPYIRFHNQKAARLLLWQKEGSNHVKEIINIPDAFQKRAYIIKNIKGMSYKEATHFLRNIGSSEDLVILDRHILAFMQRVGVLSNEDNMNKLSKNYLIWEQKFIDFIKGSIWRDSFGDSSIPQADFAIWAATVKSADSSITRERVLQLR